MRMMHIGNELLMFCCALPPFGTLRRNCENMMEAQVVGSDQVAVKYGAEDWRPRVSNNVRTMLDVVATKNRGPNGMRQAWLGNVCSNDDDI